MTAHVDFGHALEQVGVLSVVPSPDALAWLEDAAKRSAACRCSGAERSSVALAQDVPPRRRTSPAVERSTQLGPTASDDTGCVLDGR